MNKKFSELPQNVQQEIMLSTINIMYSKMVLLETTSLATMNLFKELFKHLKISDDADLTVVEILENAEKFSLPSYDVPQQEIDKIIAEFGLVEP